MSRKYTAEWVKAEADKVGAKWLDHHDCGGCGVMVGFVIDGNSVRFRSGCDCGWSPDRPSSFEEIAQWLGMQSSDEIRDRIMRGLKP